MAGGRSSAPTSSYSADLKRVDTTHALAVAAVLCNAACCLWMEARGHARDEHVDSELTGHLSAP